MKTPQATVSLVEKSFDYSSSAFFPMLCGFAPNETLVPLMFNLAEIAKIIQTNDSGLGR